MRYRVLVVDDYPDAANTICALLGIMGHDCRAATRGIEAIEIATTFLPDIALVDLGLPDISGYEVARRLRELAGDRPLFIAAVTGWAQPADRVHALAAGFDHHVLKPLDAAHTKRILELADRRHAPAS